MLFILRHEVSLAFKAPRRHNNGSQNSRAGRQWKLHCGLKTDCKVENMKYEIKEKTFQKNSMLNPF